MQKRRKEYPIKEYLINRLTLTIMGIIILSTILMGVWLDSRILSIVSDAAGLFSFLLIVIMVGTILQYNPPNDSRNCLVRWKKRISSWVEPHEHLKWLQGDKAIGFLLLYIGIIVGLCGLLLRLGLSIVGLQV